MPFMDHHIGLAEPLRYRAAAPLWLSNHLIQMLAPADGHNGRGPTGGITLTPVSASEGISHPTPTKVVCVCVFEAETFDNTSTLPNFRKRPQILYLRIFT